ncbi:MAG: Kelch repeat-containing protein [Acidobacteriaceae bacterium]
MTLEKRPPYFQSALFVFSTLLLLTLSLGCGSSSSYSGGGGGGGTPPPPNPNANQWTWMSGSSTVGAANTGQPGVYGTQGTAAATNAPGGRSGSGTWIDSTGNLWVFGGQGQDSTGTNGFLNDFWEFYTSTVQWKWVAGSKTVGAANGGQAGVYGTLGTAAAANLPGGRTGENNVTDKSGNFWLFGGNGYDAADVLGFLNDLWMFNPTTKMWTWISGSNSVRATNGGQSGVYGTQGVAAPANVPGGRTSPASWIDSNGNFWLFGGVGFDSAGTFGELNDLWEFSPTSRMWTWVSGSDTVGVTYGGPSGVYGTEGTAAAANVPGGRSPAANWTDSSGNFWLFGGEGVDSTGTVGSMNDLWEYDLSTKQWTWWSGTETVGGAFKGPSGVYGTAGTASASNVPGGRTASVGWTDKNGRFWLYGGQGFDSAGTDGYLNDLWVFDPSARGCTPFCVNDLF